jgi:beta-phosphoglucomutase-like phosphatase (HAD superfamily)
VPVEQCVVVGDTGADVQAGLAAGAAAVLVPNVATRLAEVFAGPVVCPTLVDGVDVILGARPR